MDTPKPVRAKKLENRTRSLMNFERKSVEDSGIESLGASNDKRQLKRRISKLKRQPQITEVVLMPYEIYFNGGMFTFKLYEAEAEVQKQHPDKDKEAQEIPLLSVLIDRPNVYIRQTNYEKSVKVSLADLNLTLSEVIRSKKQLQILEVAILETRTGETDHTGARKPLVQLKQVISLNKPDDVELLVQRPIKFALSHEKLRNLLKIYRAVMVPLKKKRNSRAELLQAPAKRKKMFAQVNQLMGGLKRFQMSFAQLAFEFSDKKEYDLKLMISNTEANFGLVERIERVNCELNFHNIILTSMGRTVLHPVTILTEVVVTQEAWKKEPLIAVNLKVNYLQVDLNAQLYDELILIQAQMESIFPEETADIEVEKVLESELIPIGLPIPSQKSLKRESYYEDDLRAGAFQFIQTASLSELPLPYQIQIFSNNEKSIICWRYPQPRSLIQVKIFPIPVQFERPTVFDCDLEYYCTTREKFKSVRKFSIYEDTVNVELPNRVICSSIYRVTLIQNVLPSSEDDDTGEDSFGEISSHLSHFDPQVFVGCMRVDSVYKPEFISNAEILLEVAHVQVI